MPDAGIAHSPDSFPAPTILGEANSVRQRNWGRFRFRSARPGNSHHAVKLNGMVVDAWKEHPHVYKISCEASFLEKMRKAVLAANTALGTPLGSKSFRRYLIKMPNLDALNAHPGCTKLIVLQTFLKTGGENEQCVFQHGIVGDYLFTKVVTEKAEGGLPGGVLEKIRLSKVEYLAELKKANPFYGVIHEIRYYLCEDDRCIRIDVFPF